MSYIKVNTFIHDGDFATESECLESWNSASLGIITSTIHEYINSGELSYSRTATLNSVTSTITFIDKSIFDKIEAEMAQYQDEKNQLLEANGWSRIS